MDNDDLILVGILAGCLMLILVLAFAYGRNPGDPSSALALAIVSPIASVVSIVCVAEIVKSGRKK